MLYRHHPEWPVIKPLWNREDTSVMSSQATHILNLQYSCSFRPKHISMTRLLLNVRADYHDMLNKNAIIRKGTVQDLQIPLHKTCFHFPHIRYYVWRLVWYEFTWWTISFYSVEFWYFFYLILVVNIACPVHQDRVIGVAQVEALLQAPLQEILPLPSLTLLSDSLGMHNWSDYGDKKILTYIDKLSPLATLKHPHDTETQVKKSVTLCTFLILTSHHCK